MATALGAIAESANARLLNERIERTREEMAQLQLRVDSFDALADTLAELPKKLSHPVMVPLGKRAMMPGKIVRTNEVLAHLGDEYFAWRTVPSALEIIDRKKKELQSQIDKQESTLTGLHSKRADVDKMFNLKKMYEDENIREIQESVEESERPAARATEEDIAEYFEVEEEERMKNEQAVWNWDEMMARMEELEAREERGDGADEEFEEKPQAPTPASQATALKAKGNEAFSRRKFQEAVGYYSQAIELDPSSHVLFGNRSAAYHRLKKFEEALSDAEAAIGLDATWVKGHYRKACALSALNRFNDAALAYERAFDLCPTDLSLEEKAQAMRTKAVQSAVKTQAASNSHPEASFGGSLSERGSDSSSFTSVSPSGKSEVPITGPRPLTSSSAAFSGSIMERGVVERPVVGGGIAAGSGVSSGVAAFGTAPRTSRFAGNNPGGDKVTLEPVGEPQPVKRVSRFRAARSQQQ